ncbi:M20/M25/M40 family metallo-hydrolase [Planctomicrobium sp. SH664]|uniref:M20/M25/M40 family metallo-hydrolase n=1 Tax=Planctomicrobium sp. SH664 TaxID=3448125 RepID=UPI003F5CB59E
MRPSITFSTLLCGLLAWNLAGADELSLSAQRMREDLKILASDEYEGRGIGTEGLKKAAEYIAEQFRATGLKVDVAGGDPFQEFEITDGARLGSPNTLSFSGPGGKVIDLQLDQDFRPCSFGGSGTFKAPLVFCGYGIDAKDQGFNEFANVNVRGKVVILMRRAPQQENPHGMFAVAHGISRHASLATKLGEAFTRGAVAVLLVNDPYTGRSEKEGLAKQVEKARDEIIVLAEKLSAQGATSDELLPQLRRAVEHLRQVEQMESAHVADPLMTFGYGGTRSGKSLPCFQITQQACNELLLASLKTTLQKIEAEIDETGKPASSELTGWTAAGQASIDVQKVEVDNVIGVLEGTGPLKEETIVIGAHFDHLGLGGEGSLTPGVKEIHNGADDNASGTAGLIEIARRLASRGKPLPRRIVFIAFTGEERGLLGSEEYVKNPVYPLQQTIAMFNMDMIGRMEDAKLTVFGTGTSSRWEKLVDEEAAALGLKLSKKPEGFGPSDHSSFYAHRIPVLHLFTGTHGDYHRPSDDWEKINFADMDRVINLLEKLVVETAEAPTKPDYLHIAGAASLDRSGNRPYFGSIPDFGSDVQGYALQGVSPGSPAEKAGLRGKDVIIRLGDHHIGGLDDFDLALRKFQPGEQVDVTVLRDGQEVTLKLTLGTPRG